MTDHPIWPHPNEWEMSEDGQFVETAEGWTPVAEVLEAVAESNPGQLADWEAEYSTTVPPAATTAESYLHQAHELIQTALQAPDGGADFVNSFVADQFDPDPATVEPPKGTTIDTAINMMFPKDTDHKPPDTLG